MIPAAMDGTGPQPSVQEHTIPPGSISSYHIVQYGDTLSKIAQESGETLAQIESDNPQILAKNGSWNEIYDGQRVYVGKHRAPSGLSPVVAQPATPPPAPVIVAGSYSQNLLTLAKFLAANGYSKAAAAGVAACVAGESGGNPESVGSGGGGLIGWTPLQPGMVTGNPNVDFALQLHDVIIYNNNNGNVGTLNGFTNPVAAADYYSANFERPAILYSDVVPAVANSIFAALGG